jgi:hypothetical protein
MAASSVAGRWSATPACSLRGLLSVAPIIEGLETWPPGLVSPLKKET